MRLARNVATLARHPSYLLQYARYLWSRLTHSGEPVRTFRGGIRIAALNSFSEFLSVGDFVPESELDFLTKTPFGDGVMIDIGANLGLVSCILSRRFPTAAIYAFEPNPATFPALERNLQLNACTNVRAEERAISDHDGIVLFSADPHARGTASLTVASSSYAANVPCTTLDSFLKKAHIESVAFLKVDVEGYEELVFAGSETLLAAGQVEFILYEVCPRNCVHSGLDPARPTEMLLDHNYSVYRFERPFRLVAAKPSDVKNTVSENWIATLR